MSREKQPRNLKDTLEGKLSRKEMQHLITSFDSYGNIAVIQIPKGLGKKAKVIGEALLGINKQFKTVCMVTGEHQGKYRVQPVKVIAGEKNTVATYRESGCLFRFELGKVFFSPRLATERQRIAKLIKSGEVIAAFFAGVGPFPIVFARNSPMEKAYAIELNPNAFRAMQENITLNKCQKKVEAIKGDVKKQVHRIKGKCDRVAMPLPKEGGSFLKEAFAAIKPKGGTIHFYAFVEREKGLKETLEKIKNAAKAQKRRVRILRKEKVRSFSASKDQFVIDFRVLGKKMKQILEKAKPKNLK
ncbi:MAG: class I SAM-dependent methyltransferase family protein [Candidatus Diapherotrites archaeon]|uniref:Class I SAM-dependent methyltransferase family protein n=1 Tax=Candidatus Iainarchaeum sp. TaxID=3101447 RepID=A0A939C6B1_9ARCH|nr:class I SAM-dependent methyltransferase family protein [Candidatus Diapherotrites archaeon]